MTLNAFSKDICILAVDTATESCSAALLYQGKITAQSTEAPRAHTEKILPMVDLLLKDAGITLNDVNAIAFGEGPGSFTGIRVGVSVAQGLGFGANIPLVPVSNLMTLAQGAFRVHKQTNIVAAIDARMSEIYVASFTFDKENGFWHYLVDPKVQTPDDWIETFSSYIQLNQVNDIFGIAGTGFETYPHLNENASLKSAFNQHLAGNNLFRLPLAEDMIPLAYYLYQNNKIVDPIDAEPVYLRNEVTWQKLPGKA